MCQFEPLKQQFILKVLNNLLCVIVSDFSVCKGKHIWNNRIFDIKKKVTFIFKSNICNTNVYFVFDFRYFLSHFCFSFLSFKS